MKIIYEDHEILVVYKEAGLATQSGRIGQRDLVSELKKSLSASGGGAYLGLVHRLDQPVEGLLVFGKTKEATAHLTAQLQSAGLGKHYYAVSPGAASAPEGTLVDYLKKDPAANLQQVVEKGTPQAQEARLTFRHLAECDGLHLYQITLETGRFHQIRVQMAHAGMPLIGDQKYGDIKAREAAKAKGVRNVALCAYELKFMHPKTKKEMYFEIRPEGSVFMPLIQKAEA